MERGHCVPSKDLREEDDQIQAATGDTREQTSERWFLSHLPDDREDEGAAPSSPPAGGVCDHAGCNCDHVGCVHDGHDHGAGHGADTIPAEQLPAVEHQVATSLVEDMAMSWLGDALGLDEGDHSELPEDRKVTTDEMIDYLQVLCQCS